MREIGKEASLWRSAQNICMIKNVTSNAIDYLTLENSKVESVKQCSTEVI